jgi:hypothetical protein
MDQPVTAGLNITTLLATDVLYVARPSTGQDCYITAAALIASLGKTPVSYVSCLHNATTHVPIDSLLGNFRSITLDCYFIRNGKTRKEIIQIFYDPTTQVASFIEGEIGTIPASETDLGITLSISYSFGLILNVALDSDVNNAGFYFSVISIIS